MTVRCDLHAISREMKVEVRVCNGRSHRMHDETFVVLEVRVENGWVTMFLEPDQALELAQSISRFIKPLDEADESDAEALPEREVSRCTSPRAPYRCGATISTWPSP